MANAYNQPQKGQFMQTYVSQHIPLPFEEIQHAIAQKNIQADRVAQFTDAAVTAAGNIKALAGDDSKYLMAKQEDLNQFVDQLTGQDLTDPEVIKGIRYKVREFSGDPNLSKIEAMYNKAQELQANIADMAKQGHLYDENVYAAQKALSEYTKEGNGGFASGIDFDPTITKGVDVFGELSKYYAQLQASGGESIAKLAAKDGGIAYKEGWSGITKGDVKKQAISVFDEAINSQAGQQLKRRYFMEMDRAGKKPTEEGAISYISKALLAAGEGKIHSKTTTNADVAMREKRKEDQEAATQPGLLEEYNTPFMKGIQPLTFDKNGKLTGSGTRGYWDIVSEEGFAGSVRKWMEDKGVSKEEAEVFRNVTIGAKISGMSEQDYYKLMKRNISVKTEDYVKAKSAENASKIVWNQGGGNWHSLQVLGKDGTKTSFAEFARKVTGIDVDEDGGMEEAVDALKKKGFQISGELGPNPFVAKGAYGNIGNTSFIIDYSRSRATKKDLEEHHIQKVRAEGVVEDYEVIGGKKVKVYDIYNPKTGDIESRTEQQLKNLNR